MPTPTIDLRSDTVTQPSPAMREAIAHAPVGDDVLGDDPTVIELERYVADLLGKEAAVYMPSGTMTNQVAIRVHTEPGDEVVLDAQAHVYYYEGGAPAALSGVSCQLVHGDRGIFTAEDLVNVLRPYNPHFPHTRLVCLENTHNRGGGRIFPLEHVRAIAQVCRERNLRLHMDGARLWNACAATGISAAEHAAPFDTVSVCFSKGLGAPVGSALVGSADLIERARRFRKMFGGSMRQAGIIAAGALYAVQHHRDRLVDDHENAKELAIALQSIDGIHIDPAEVETNILFFNTVDVPAAALAKTLAELGVALLSTGSHRLRAVTHLMVSREQIEHVPNLVEKAIHLIRTGQSSY